MPRKLTGCTVEQPVLFGPEALQHTLCISDLVFDPNGIFFQRFGEEKQLTQGIEVHANDGSTLIQIGTPVDERVQGQGSGGFVKMFGHFLRLLQRDIVKFFHQRGITCMLQIIIQAGDQEQRIIRERPYVDIRRGIREDAGCDHLMLRTVSGEEIDAPFDQIKIPEGNIIGQCLQTKITDPEAAVSLGAILEDILFAFLQRFEGHIINLLQLCVLYRKGGCIGKLHRRGADRIQIRDIDGEIGGAVIAFESNNINGVIERSRIVDKAVSSFELFNVTMGLHGMTIGSVSHQNVNAGDDDIINCLSKQYHNYIVREEHACYYDDKIACIYLNNGVYDSDKLLKDYNHEVIEGIHGKVLLQHKCDWTFYNYIDNDEWNILQKIIKKRKLTNYKLLCQSNRLYIIADNEIWIITGWFHHGIADLEKEEILERNQKERALLLANRDFSWKYPINYSRFEELCADLLEQLYPTSRVRLAGNANNADGERDVLVYNSDDTLYICQCKAYT